MDNLQPGGIAYNECEQACLSGRLNVSALCQSVDEIVRRHEVLRTTFETVEGEPVQRIGRAEGVKLTIVDVSELPEIQRQAEIKRLTTDVVSRPFDLASGPLLRVLLVREGEEQNRMIVTAHHIILDGWSIGIFGGELAKLYTAFCFGFPSPLEELPIQYADFAMWQRQWLQEEDLKPQLDYWTEQLRDLPPLLQLPVAKPRPEVQSFRGARQHFQLDRDLSRALLALSRKENTTLFITLLAGFQTLLYRYSQQTDIAVGTVIANRNQPHVEQLIGFFVNTLVLRGDLRGNPSFRQYLQQMSHVAVSAYEHHEIPFEYVVETLKPERSSSYNPLFQVLFNLHNTPKPKVSLPGVTLTSLPTDSVTAKFDLTLSMEDTAQGLQGSWEYNRDLFEAATIQRMTGHLQTLLEAIVEDPETRIGELPLLSMDERRQVLLEWNRTDLPYPQDKCIHQLIEDQVRRNPDGIAVIHGDNSVSYRELNRRANQVAHYLRAQGVGPEVLVGVCMDRCVELLIAMLGILKAGGAYIPLDPKYPDERLRIISAESAFAVLYTTTQMLERLHGIYNDDVTMGGCPRIVCADAIRDELTRMERRNPSIRAVPNNLAYVLYTSGSTGTPKGVAISHRNCSALLHWALDNYTPLERACVAASTSVCFDLSIVELFVPLAGGTTILLVADIFELSTLNASQIITLLNTVPSAITELVDLNAISRSVCTVNLAGEPLRPEVVNKLYNNHNIQRVYDLYGPTEDTTYSTFCLRSVDGAATIGRPISNRKVFVLDHKRQLVPVGVPGELFLGGAGQARGYVNHPEWTAERFGPDPFSTKPGQRLYSTGDCGRYCYDGQIELFGRVDEQIKLRGFRIEPAEIVSFLLRHPKVREAVVTLHPTDGESKRLIAYVSAASGAAVSSTELREHLERHLPGHAVPSAIIVLESLPRLPNGKVDRKALPRVDPHQLQQNEQLPEEWSQLERSIADLWQRTLGITSVGLDDKFFQIGGDSLTIIRVYSGLRAVSSKSLSITDLFKYPTVRSLATFLSS